MKKNAILIALLLSSGHAHAKINLKKIAGSLIRCSWHVSKIGGGALCLGIGIIPFSSSYLFGALPDVPHLNDTPQDDALVDNYIEGVARVINELTAQSDAAMQSIQPNHTNTYPPITREQIETAKQWCHNNRATVRDYTHTIKSMHRGVRNYSIGIFLGFWIAGTSSMWSGLKGLIHEISSDDAESAQANKADPLD